MNTTAIFDYNDGRAEGIRYIYQNDLSFYRGYREAIRHACFEQRMKPTGCAFQTPNMSLTTR